MGPAIHRLRRITRWTNALLLLSLSSCAPSQPVSLRFRALLAGRPFRCGETYGPAGKTASHITLSDLRLYVSKLRLIRRDGHAETVVLEPDGSFQSATTSLVDFEDGSTSCLNGTRATHVSLRGHVAPGDYHTLAFELGVPEQENHQDASQAPAPLDVSSMFWVWRSGYKFLRLEGRTRADEGSHAFSVHVGSTGCSGGSPTDRPTHCTHPNRAEIKLAHFAPDRDSVDLHVDALLAGLTLHGPQASDGCEASPDDPDCAPVLDALGLGSKRPGQQRVFRVGQAP